MELIDESVKTHHCLTKYKREEIWQELVDLVCMILMGNKQQNNFVCYLVGAPAWEDAPIDCFLIVVRLDQKVDERT